LTYLTEFPDFDDAEHCEAAIALGFDEDTSWHNDSCPSFQCDVFVIWVDFADPAKRELDNGPRFVMQDEGEAVVETDNWDDIVREGKRNVPAYAYREVG
jgi:hypothetical protein